MKLGLLFSGGKDSSYAGFLASKYGHEIKCLISIISDNEDSFMFHTPLIELTKKQADSMRLPLIVRKTKGQEELELEDLEKAIEKGIKDYKIEGIVTGAVESVYQATRIQKICDKLKIHCFNPLWKKNQIELLEELIKNRFELVVSGVAAFPFDKTWVGRKIDKKFIEDIKELEKKYKINPAGEGGEFESFVVNCPLFEKPIELNEKKVRGDKNNFRMVLE
jgi:diphthine-ammonia ligase